MSINSEIQDLTTNLAAAKAAVTTKGGTVGDTGLAGLATEIASIPSGGSSATDWGVISFHNYSNGWEWSPTGESNCSLSIVDQDKFNGFYSNNLMFQEDQSYTEPSIGDVRNLGTVYGHTDDDKNWELSFTDYFGGSYSARYNINDPTMLEFTTGLSLTIDPGATDIEFDAEGTYSTIMSSDVLRLEIDEDIYNGLYPNDSGKINIGPFEIEPAAIVGFEFGTMATSTPTNFLRETAIESIDFSHAQSLTSIGYWFLFGCTSFNHSLTLPQSLTVISNFFLGGCTSFNQSLTLPQSLNSIGEGFLGNCTSFNQSLTLPQSLNSIGRGFLSGCTSFNQNLILPQSLNNANVIGASFLYNCQNMTGTVDVGALRYDAAATNTYTFATSYNTAPVYTTGITIAGTNRAAWLSRFPNRTSSPYRKLLDAGH